MLVLEGLKVMLDVVANNHLILEQGSNLSLCLLEDDPKLRSQTIL
jgi:hypothetical protein